MEETKVNPLSLQIDPALFEPATDEEKRQADVMSESTTFFKDGMRKLMKNPLAVGSIIVLLLVVLTITIAPLVVPYTYSDIIRVNGNSMEPTYCDGDLVFVRHAASLQEGEIGIFVTGDTGYIKEYHRDGLYSHNPAYQPIIFSEGTEVRCIGRVIGKVSQDDWADDESIEKWKTAKRKGR